MPPRTLVLALALIVAGVPAAAVGQTSSRAHSVDFTQRLAVIKQNPPNGSVYAGEVRGKPFGTAAVIARNQRSGTTATGKIVIYARRGTVTANVTNEIEPQPDGSVQFPGTFKVMGGTRLYKGATGKGRFDGSLAAGSSVYVFHVTGKLRY